MLLPGEYEQLVHTFLVRKVYAKIKKQAVEKFNHVIHWRDNVYVNVAHTKTRRIYIILKLQFNVTKKANIIQCCYFLTCRLLKISIKQIHNDTFILVLRKKIIHIDRWLYKRRS